MKNKLNWIAHTKNDRVEVIEQIKSCLQSNNAHILNFNMFSDLALSMMIEVEERNVVTVHHQLSQLLVISQLVKGEFRDNSRSAWIIFLNITFARGEGKLGHMKPPVPG